jgi:DNA-3-methyladenine glycosylase I
VVTKQRCGWAERSARERDYHDREWGVPVHDDRRLFEFLLLEGAQAGLSWTTILAKRDNYCQAFDGFDAARIACYDQQKLEELLHNPGIIRNKLKIQAAVGNARAFLEIQGRFGSFDAYVWKVVGGKAIQNAWHYPQEIPSRTLESDILSQSLRKHGFKFVGTTICYAFMQVVGMVNDHIVGCFRYPELGGDVGSWVSQAAEP